MTKTGLHLLLVLLVSALLVTSTLASEGQSPMSTAGSTNMLPRDHPGVMATDRFSVSVTEPAELLITVEQRFFNRAGNEQVGLRESTDLGVPPGGSYVVPRAGPGYEDIACDTVDARTEERLVGEGQGTFVAEASGRHLACYRQLPGTPGGPSSGPPGTDDVEVLGVALERTEDATYSAVLGTALARTGGGLTSLLFVAGLCLLFGVTLLGRRRPSR